MSGASCLPFASDGWLTLTTKLARSAIDLARLTDTDVPEIVLRQSQRFFKQKEPELATARCCVGTWHSVGRKCSVLVSMDTRSPR